MNEISHRLVKPQVGGCDPHNTDRECSGPLCEAAHRGGFAGGCLRFRRHWVTPGDNRAVALRAILALSMTAGANLQIERTSCGMALTPGAGIMLNFEDIDQGRPAGWAAGLGNTCSSSDFP
jgi:hypothetical protein